MGEHWRVPAAPSGGPSPRARQAATLTELLAAQRPHTTPGELAVFRHAIEPFLARHSLAQLQRATRAMAREAHFVTDRSVATFVRRHCRQAGRGLSEQARRQARAEQHLQIAEEAHARRAPALAWEHEHADERSDYWCGRLILCLPQAVEDVLEEWRATGRGPDRARRSDLATEQLGLFERKRPGDGA